MFGGDRYATKNPMIVHIAHARRPIASMSASFLRAMSSRAHDAATVKSIFMNLTDDAWLIILGELTARDLARALATGNALWSRLIRAGVDAGIPPPAVRVNAARRSLHLDHMWLQSRSCWRLMPDPTPRPRLNARARQRALDRGIDLDAANEPAKTWHCPMHWAGGSWLVVLYAAELTSFAQLVPTETHPAPNIISAAPEDSWPDWRFRVEVALPQWMWHRSPLVTLTATAFRTTDVAPLAPDPLEWLADGTTCTIRVTDGRMVEQNRRQVVVLRRAGGDWRITTTWDEQIDA